MGNTVLLLESRDLCYESNRYFVECMAEAFENLGYPVETCDLSVQLEERLEGILERREQFCAAIDFNSLLPRIETEDGTPYITALGVPFFNYLVDHPLYHHVGLKKGFPGYSVICIDICHKKYIEEYYPQIEQVFYLPLGAMKADGERSLGQKRLELLFLGTYEDERALYLELDDYKKEQRQEILALIEMMDAEHELTQEEALKRYYREKGETVSRELFVQRMNADYLADKYLRNVSRRRAVTAAAAAGVPFTVIGHGWEQIGSTLGKHVAVRPGIGFAAAVQMIADARMLLNVTPGFCGGLHDRVYSAMINRTACFTESSRFAKGQLEDGKDAILYDSGDLEDLTEKIAELYAHPVQVEQIAERAFQKASRQDTWQKRAEQIAKRVSCR